MSSTQTLNQISLIDELNINSETGFTKSVNTLYKDILRLMNHRTIDGFRSFKYYKKWETAGSLMSPIFLNYQGVAYNNICLTDSEINRLCMAVCTKLRNEKITVLTSTIKYTTADLLKYYMLISIELEVKQPSTANTTNIISTPAFNSSSPSGHNPGTHDYDFNCASC